MSPSPAAPIRISPTLALPVDAVTQKGAFLGSPGSGKTYAAKKLAEQMLDVGAQVVVLDPVGPWYALRIAAAGPGRSVVVFGGQHADIPIEADSGAAVADLICDRGLSAVIDLSLFDEEELWLFAEDFGRQFFNRHQQQPAAVALFLEECQEIIPERGTGAKGMIGMSRVYRRMQKIGRNYGIGMWLISQRPQEVSKMVLNLSECLFAFQMQGSTERDAVAGWIAEKGERADLAAILPKLARGEAHVWSPRWLKINETVRIGQCETFDASATPEVGVNRLVPQEISRIDLSAIAEAMAATIEKRRQEDPEVLRERIEELEAELAEKPGGEAKRAPASADPALIEAAEKRGRESVLSLFRAPIHALLRTSDSFTDALRTAEGNERPSELSFGQPDDDDESGELADLAYQQSPPRPLAPQRADNTRAGRGPESARRETTRPGSLPEGERLILTAIAQHRAGVSRKHISILTGYKRSTRDAYLQRLSGRSLIDTGGEAITATLAGIETLGPGFEPLPVGKQLRAHWLARLPEGEARVLTVLVSAGKGRGVLREAISEATGYKRSTRDAYIQRLCVRRLARPGRGGGIEAAQELF